MDISSISQLHKSTQEERQSNLSYLRGLYFLFALHLVVAWLWSLICITNEAIGDFVRDIWPIALVTGIVALIVLLVCLLVPKSRDSPVNWVLYLVFLITFAYTAAFFSVLDTSLLFFYSLTLLTAIAIAFCIYSL